MTELAERRTGGASSRMHVNTARRLSVCVLVACAGVGCSGPPGNDGTKHVKALAQCAARIVAATNGTEEKAAIEEFRLVHESWSSQQVEPLVSYGLAYHNVETGAVVPVSAPVPLLRGLIAQRNLEIRLTILVDVTGKPAGTYKWRPHELENIWVLLLE